MSMSLSMSRSCVHDIKTKLFAKLPPVPAKVAVNLLDHELFACFIFLCWSRVSDLLDDSDGRDYSFGIVGTLITNWLYDKVYYILFCSNVQLFDFNQYISTYIYNQITVGNHRKSRLEKKINKKF